MADTITSSRELKLDYEFADGDTRITSLPNPRNDITARDIDDVSANLLETQAFVGDKNNGEFSRIKSAVIVETTRRKLDLS